MIELNPEIMKRSLPPNIHATVDQVTANVNAAVDEIVNRFISKAAAQVEKFEKADFTPELAKALEEAKKELNSDIAAMDAKLTNLNAAIAQAQTLAQTAGANAAALSNQLAAVNGSATALQQELGAFRSKVDTFAAKSGGFIATSALRAVGVG